MAQQVDTVFPRARRRLGHGFTLAEVMLAIGILGIGLIAVASVFPVAILQQKRATDETMGVVVGNNVLAQLQAADLDSSAFPVSLKEAFVPAQGQPSPQYSDPTDTYRYRVAYKRPSEDGPVDLAVFVYRRDADRTTPDPSDTIAIGTRVDVNIADETGVMSGGDTNGNVLARNQIVLADVELGNAFVLRVIKKEQVAIPPVTSTDRMLFLYDDGPGPNDYEWDVSAEDIVRASAIVIGRIN